MSEEAVSRSASDPPSGEAPSGEAPLGEPSSGESSAAGEGAESASPWDDARLPWNGKPGRADIACWAGIVLSGFFYLSLLPFRAALVGTHPLLGVFLNGGTESIISASAFARVGHGSLILVFLAAIPGLMKFDILFWWAGRLWGERIILLMSGRRKAGQKAIDRVQKWGWRFTWPAVVLATLLPVPKAVFYVAAGWAGMSWVTFIILDLIGSVMWIGLLMGLGYALGQHAVHVARAISHYGLWVTIAIVVLVVVSQMRSVRMHR